MKKVLFVAVAACEDGPEIKKISDAVFADGKKRYPVPLLKFESVAEAKKLISDCYMRVK